MESLLIFSFFLISGIFVFFRGLKIIAKNLADLLKPEYFRKFNSLNPFSLLLIGILLSSIIQSTSASLALTIPFIHTGLISSLNAIYLLLGFNIGTSSTLIINNFDKLGFSLLFFGLFLFFYIIRNMLANFKTKLSSLSFLFLGIGLIFFSLNMLNKSVIFLMKIPIYLKFIDQLTLNYFNPFLLGIISSLLIQSSSVVLSTFQQLYISSNINLVYIILISLGGNIGSTITGIIASLKFDKSAKLVAYFNILFNVGGSIIFLILLEPLASFIIFVRSYFNLSTGYDMVICHFIINFGSMIIFFPLVKYIYNLLNFYFFFATNAKKQSKNGKRYIIKKRNNT